VARRLLQRTADLCEDRTLRRGLISIKPTIDILRWVRQSKSNSHYAVPDGEVRTARRFVLAEAAVFALIPIFASLMARGYGL